MVAVNFVFVFHRNHPVVAGNNENGIIKTEDAVFHKNNLANLMTLCEKCHNDLHKTNTKQKRVKTSKGTLLSKL